MGRFRDALAEDLAAVAQAAETPAKKAAPDHSKALMRHALGLAHYLNKMKKSGQFKKAGARGR